MQDTLRELWTEDGQRTPVDRVRSFDGKLPESVLSKGSSTARLDLASYLMMAMPGGRLPPIKLTVFERTYDRLEYPQADGKDLAGRYEHALAFLDRLIAESQRKGMNGPKTRMDAQSIVWSLRDNGESASETEVSATPETVAVQTTLATNSILYGPPGTGKTYETVQRCVEICDGNVPDGQDAMRARYDELVAEGRIEFVTFHQSYGYEELVEGIRPVTLEDGIAYRVQDGVLKKLAAFASSGLAWARLCTHARSAPTVCTKLQGTEYALTEEADTVELRPLRGGENRRYRKANVERLWRLQHMLGDPARTTAGDIERHWDTGTHGYYLWMIYNEMWHLMQRQDNCVLVIDEINRANISKVFGELITLLEEDKREGAANEVTVTLPFSQERFTLPPNLHILGTMNTADRSIALLDTALRRRFQFEEMTPQPKRLTGARDRTGVDLPRVLDALNARLEYLVDRDHLVGHAWFMQAQGRHEVDVIMRRKIIPLLAEYFYDDWSKVHAVLGGGDGFLERQRLHQPPGLEDETGEARYRWSVRSEFAADAYETLVAGVASDQDE